MKPNDRQANLRPNIFAGTGNGLLRDNRGRLLRVATAEHGVAGAGSEFRGTMVSAHPNWVRSSMNTADGGSSQGVDNHVLTIRRLVDQGLGSPSGFDAKNAASLAQRPPWVPPIDAFELAWPRYLVLSKKHITEASLPPEAVAKVAPEQVPDLLKACRFLWTTERAQAISEGFLGCTDDVSMWAAAHNTSPDRIRAELREKIQMTTRAFNEQFPGAVAAYGGAIGDGRLQARLPMGAQVSAFGADPDPNRVATARTTSTGARETATRRSVYLTYTSVDGETYRILKGYSIEGVDKKVTFLPAITAVNPANGQLVLGLFDNAYLHAFAEIAKGGNPLTVLNQLQFTVSDADGRQVHEFKPQEEPPVDFETTPSAGAFMVTDTDA